MPVLQLIHMLQSRQVTTPSTTPSTNPADILNGTTKLATWDGCMAKSYCKWPVIIGIIIGCICAFSILWCLVRCICLGKDFACCCFRCLSCCCGPKRTPEGMKYDNVGSAPPTRAGQYASHGKMQYGNDAFGQTAVFEGPVHADSLPSMPSWDSAASRKVEVLEKAPESVEMEPLKESKAPSLRGGTPTPRPTGLSRTQSGFDDVSQSPRLGPSRTNSGMDAMPSPLRNNNGYNGAPQRTNGGHSGMPSPVEPTLPNMYGSGNRTPRAAASPVYSNDQYGAGNRTPRAAASPVYANDQYGAGTRTPRAAASPVYGNDQYGSSRGIASGRNTPQTPYSAGGYNGGRSTPRSPYGPPTTSSYSTANNGGYGPPSTSNYSTPNDGYDVVDDYMSSGSSQYKSGRGGQYDSGYGSTNGADYSSYGDNSSQYKQQQQQQPRRPVPGQQQGSYM